MHLWISWCLFLLVMVVVLLNSYIQSFQVFRGFWTAQKGVFFVVAKTWNIFANTGESQGFELRSSSATSSKEGEEAQSDLALGSCWVVLSERRWLKQLPDTTPFSTEAPLCDELPGLSQDVTKIDCNERIHIIFPIGKRLDLQPQLFFFNILSSNIYFGKKDCSI